ncbi:MAG: LamG domain-containing protein [Limisphaerales bacterium]
MKTPSLWIAVLLLFTLETQAQLIPPGDSTNAPLDSWSFLDHTNWTSDLGYSPVSFTNINYSYLGDFNSLVVDTNVVAWLQYNVYESDNTTNLTVDSGTVTFWFGPDWSSADDTNGGFGPQEYGRLFEVGGYTTNSSYGWWSIYVDSGGTNLYFSSQTNDGSGNTYTLSVPIDWTTNYFHFIALTYSSTNVSLYLDGQLATNDPGGLNLWPGMNVLSNGFFIGSDSSGVYQAHGMFDLVATYNYPLDSNDVQSIYQWETPYYEMNPYNTAMEQVSSAPSNPSSAPTYDAITGQGSLQLVGSAASCSDGTNADNIWITNVVATMVGGGTNATMNLTFTIEGGSNDVPYDVFANSVLSFGTNGIPWAWEGQGYQCNTYTLTNLPNTTCFLILGSPQDSDGDGLTDAYELLVSKSDPHNYNTSGDGLSDGWDVLLGLSPLVNQFAQPGTRSNYDYDSADWLEGISGIRTGTVNLDNEGNVLSVSQ